MKYAMAMEFAAGLESGKYKQGAGALRRSTGEHCCLGVACEIAVAKKLTHRYNPPETTIVGVERAGLYTYGSWECPEQAFMPPDVVKAFGFATRDGRRKDGGDIVFLQGKFKSLLEANDAGVPFSDIAAFVKKHWELL